MYKQTGGDSINNTKKPKINFRYHNPNTKEETMYHITKIFIDANRVKFENVLSELAKCNKENGEDPEKSPAS